MSEQTEAEAPEAPPEAPEHDSRPEPAEPPEPEAPAPFFVLSGDQAEAQARVAVAAFGRIEDAQNLVAMLRAGIDLDALPAHAPAVVVPHISREPHTIRVIEPQPKNPPGVRTEPAQPRYPREVPPAAPSSFDDRLAGMQGLIERTAEKAEKALAAAPNLEERIARRLDGLLERIQKGEARTTLLEQDKKEQHPVMGRIEKAGDAERIARLEESVYQRHTPEIDRLSAQIEKAVEDLRGDLAAFGDRAAEAEAQVERNVRSLEKHGARIDKLDAEK